MVSFPRFYDINIYIILPPNLGLEITVLGREREQGRFKESSEGAEGSSKGARGSNEGVGESIEGVGESNEGARESNERVRESTKRQCRGAVDGA